MEMDNDVEQRPRTSSGQHDSNNTSHGTAPNGSQGRKWLGEILQVAYDASERFHVGLQEAITIFPPFRARSDSHLYKFYREFFVVTEDRESKEGYTHKSFDALMKPLPVEDVFFNAKVINTLRLILQGATRLSAFYLTFNVVTSPNWLVLTAVTSALQSLGVGRIGRIPIPTVRQLWYFHRYPQWLWETVAARLLLRRKFQRWAAHRVWWFVYLLIARTSDFEQNFFNAWSRESMSDLRRRYRHNYSPNLAEERSSDGFQQHRSPNESDQASSEPRTVRSIHAVNVQESNLSDDRKVYIGLLFITLRDEQLYVPIRYGETEDSSAVLRQVRMFYRHLKIKQGLTEILLPRTLIQIDCIEIEDLGSAGKVTRRLECGRRLQIFHQPDAAATTKMMAICHEIKLLSVPNCREGLEFIRVLNRRSISGVIMAPFTASIVFLIIWVSVYLKRSPEQDAETYKQAVIGTAFTGASFLVTAGALITALAGYLDNRVESNGAYGKQRLASRTMQDSSTQTTYHSSLRARQNRLQRRGSLSPARTI